MFESWGGAGRKREETEDRDAGLLLSGAKGSFGTCLALGHMDYIMSVGVRRFWGRCAAGICVHPSTTGRFKVFNVVS